MPEKLSDIEIDKAAWKELLAALKSVDVDGDFKYGDDADRVYDRMDEIIQELKERHL